MLIGLYIYLVVINIVGFAFMRYDKTQAGRRRRRVPEKRLFTIAAVGGALGSMLGMRVFHHKTKHRTFVIGMPALLILNAVCVYVIYKLAA